MSDEELHRGSLPFRILTGLSSRPGTLRLLLLLLLAALASTAGAQNFGLRNVQGKVLGAHDEPINGAIVYLQNSRNNDIRTFISTSNGSYHFAGIAADTDFTLWAAYKNKKSSTKTVSSFDSRKLVIMDLHIKD